jgi:hypothetical protein
VITPKSRHRAPSRRQRLWALIQQRSLNARVPDRDTSSRPIIALKLHVLLVILLLRRLPEALLSDVRWGVPAASPGPLGIGDNSGVVYFRSSRPILFPIPLSNAETDAPLASGHHYPPAISLLGTLALRSCRARIKPNLSHGIVDEVPWRAECRSAMCVWARTCGLFTLIL